MKRRRMTFLPFDIQFRGTQRDAHLINVTNGWWDDRRRLMTSGVPGAQANVILACLALVTSEVAEAMEAVRKHDPDTWSDAETKDTLVRELAGAVVRCMDLAGELDLPLAEAIRAEIDANAARGFRHGGNAA